MKRLFYLAERAVFVLFNIFMVPRSQPKNLSNPKEDIFETDNKNHGRKERIKKGLINPGIVDMKRKKRSGKKKMRGKRKKEKLKKKEDKKGTKGD